MNPKDMRATLLRAKARAFARTVRDSNMAVMLPDELIDWCADQEIFVLREHLKAFGLVQRKDYYWELAQ